MQEVSKFLEKFKSKSFLFCVIIAAALTALIPLSYINEENQDDFNYTPPNSYLNDSLSDENSNLQIEKSSSDNDAKKDKNSQDQTDISSSQQENESEFDKNNSEEYVPEFPININTASAEDLKFINGIGEITAQKIIDYRNSAGVIRDVRELVQISGIGESTVEKLAEYFYVADDVYFPYQEPRNETPQQEIPDESEENFDENENSSNFVSSSMPEFSEPDSSNQEEITPSQPDNSSEISEPASTYSYVHLNYASAEEISNALLLDISLAEKIVELRAQIGKFSAVEELLLVDSIHDEDINEFKDYVIID